MACHVILHLSFVVTWHVLQKTIFLSCVVIADPFCEKIVDPGEKKSAKRPKTSDKTTDYIDAIADINLTDQRSCLFICLTKSNQPPGCEQKPCSPNKPSGKCTGFDIYTSNGHKFNFLATETRSSQRLENKRLKKTQCSLSLCGRRKFYALLQYKNMVISPFT